MKRKLSLIVLLTTVALVVAACGGAATEAPAADTTDAPEAVATEAMAIEKIAGECNIEPPAEAVEVNIIGWPFEIMDFYTAEFELCNDVENLEVNSQRQDSTATKEIFRLAMAGGGESPWAIAHFANTGINEFGFNGWLLPLNDLIDQYSDEYDLGDISDVAWEGATLDGVIYGIPATANTLHLAYRSDILEENGVAVPTTYAEVIEACGTLGDLGEFDLVFSQDFTAGWAWDIEFLAFNRAHGGKYLNDDGTPAFNGPEGVAAAQQMKDLVDACGGDLFLQTGYETAEVAINNGSQIMVHLWASNTPTMFNPDETDFVDVIKFAPAPAAIEGGLLVGSAWHDFFTIPSTSTVDPDLAFRIIMEGLDNESQVRASELGIVTRTSVAILSTLPNGEAAATTIAGGIGIYDPRPATSLVTAALSNWMPFIGTGEMTPQEALDAAAEEYLAEATIQGFIE